MARCRQGRRGYRDSCTGHLSKVTTEEWEAMGFNGSMAHPDIVATSNRVVMAHWADGSTKVISNFRFERTAK